MGIVLQASVGAFVVLFVLAGCVTPPAPVAATSPSTPAPSAPVAAETITPPAPSTSPQPPLGAALKRGVNLGDALDAPSEGDWGVVLQPSDFVAAKRAGFDHVRLPARFSAHAAAAPPFSIDAAFFARVDWAIDEALSQGLAIVVDVHHYADLMDQPEQQHARFVGLWSQIAERERSRPRGVVFELCNEPNGKITADEWNAIMADALAVVRTTNPTRAVVLEGLGWASAKALRDSLRVPAGDPNLVGSFHMYQPILFTHQGASFMPEEFDTRGIVFPGPPAQPLEAGPGARRHAWAADWVKRYNEEPAATNPSSPARVIDELDVAHSFAERTRLPVYMGEFGVIENADPKSRAAWTRLVRTEAERRGFGWAYWDDGGAFKIYDRKSGEYDPRMRAALMEP
ncbi:MAG TPA: cellulase family glycosylhydrolase [Polyangiaceae bacterium]|nr:cellulase family glycosylhydrolase [Polyangiaceae bacterium]